MDTHRWLDAELAGRHARAARGLAPAGGPADVTVPVVLRTFTPAAIVRGAMTFAAGLSTVDADAWFRCYTRALFLFGDPANVAVRHPPAAVDAGTAWLGVYDAQRTTQVRRLLRPVSGVLPAALDTTAGTGRPGWRLTVATAGLDLARYLVHLHHTVAEAVLDGTLPAGASVALHHVRHLDPAGVIRSGYATVRVHPAGPDRPPRLYTVLTRADHRADPTAA
jgi:hypothetical protein